MWCCQGWSSRKPRQYRGRVLRPRTSHRSAILDAVDEGCWEEVWEVWKKVWDDKSGKVVMLDVAEICSVFVVEYWVEGGFVTLSDSQYNAVVHKLVIVISTILGPCNQSLVIEECIHRFYHQPAEILTGRLVSAALRSQHLANPMVMVLLQSSVLRRRTESQTQHHLQSHTLSVCPISN